MTGEIEGTNHKAFFNWVLVIKEVGNNNNFENYEKLDEIKRTVRAGMNLEIESIEF